MTPCAVSVVGRSKGQRGGTGKCQHRGADHGGTRFHAQYHYGEKVTTPRWRSSAPVLDALSLAFSLVGQVLRTGPGARPWITPQGEQNVGGGPQTAKYQQ